MNDLYTASIAQVSSDADVLALQQKFNDGVLDVIAAIDVATVTLARKDIVDACHYLKGSCGYEQLIDLCGVDMSEYPEHDAHADRFYVVYHLLSVRCNKRIRLKVSLNEREWVDSVSEVWPTANWFEREAFEMYGIIFNHHPDLRRLLTDYGFDGHPMRKDFPVTGRTELFFDETQWRCVYRPNKVENRELTPKTWPGVDRG
ncbi:MAG: NADH-quinone oxidoreductase subunit C [Mariprofundaceae bacterium]|nr:NADH-quinone oxidoreductase subunit C [Mariprofundaceae bacterium]